MVSEPPTPAAPDVPRRARWGLGDAAAGMLAGLLLSSFVASIWLGVTGDEQLTLGGLAVSQLGLWTGLGGSVLWASRRKGTGDLGEDFGWRLRPVDLLVGLLCAVVAHLFLDQVLARLLGPLLGDPDVSEPVEELVDSAKGLRIVGLLAFVSVGAPVVEELFFRGLLLRGLQRRFSVAVAIVLSGVLFGLAHLQALDAGALVLVIVSLAFLGFFLAGLAVRTGRLGPAIVTHAAFNAMSVAAVSMS
jgi:membrane protease YdiL (CAAX protease family)